MSRSRRRTPIHGITTSRSERWDKRHWHSRHRQAEREALGRGDELMPHVREVSDPWGMAKDGKRYWPDRSTHTGRWMRK